MENNRFQVAVIQLYSEPLELDKNFHQAETQIRAAASNGSSLIVLPEYHLSGWAPEDDRFRQVADRYDDFLAKYCSLASELGLCIVPGTIIARNSDDDLVNVAAFIDSHGNVLGTYTKKNLWHPERAHLTAGISDPHVAFDTPLGKVGLLICWDLAFPEAFRELIVQGAELIITPAFWLKTDGQDHDDVIYNPTSEQVLLDSMLVCRAFEHNCAVIFCNTGGSCDPYLGISQVTLPLLGTLARLSGAKEAILYADIDFNVVKAAESTYKIRADLAKTNWHYK